MNDDDYLYVNSKQYLRILQRREKRKKLMANNEKNKKEKPKYKHESRHKHAMNRQRGKGGRFVSKNMKDKECDSELKTEKEEINKDNTFTNINETNDLN